jgi:hypothetical protein
LEAFCRQKFTGKRAAKGPAIDRKLFYSEREEVASKEVGQAAAGEREVEHRDRQAPASQRPATE